MNYIKDVCKVLGLNPGDQFTIEDQFPIGNSKNIIYRITEANCLEYNYNGEWLSDPTVMLKYILLGWYSIKKISPTPVLTEEELEYLRSIIKPFFVDYIESTKESIEIAVYKAAYKGEASTSDTLNNTRFCGYHIISIPKTDIMSFKGLDENRKYSLKELDL